MADQSEITLSQSLTGDDAEKLAGEILAVRGKALALNASEVEKIDTSCIEVLIAGRKLWADEDSDFIFTEISEKFEAALASLGLNKSMMETGDNLA